MKQAHVEESAQHHDLPADSAVEEAVMREGYSDDEEEEEAVVGVEEDQEEVEEALQEEEEEEEEDEVEEAEEEEEEEEEEEDEEDNRNRREKSDYDFVDGTGAPHLLEWLMLSFTRGCESAHWLCVSCKSRRGTARDCQEGH
jgi:hypothetical protein